MEQERVMLGSIVIGKTFLTRSFLLMNLALALIFSGLEKIISFYLQSNGGTEVNPIGIILNLSVGILYMHIISFSISLTLVGVIYIMSKNFKEKTSLYSVPFVVSLGFFIIMYVTFCNNLYWLMRFLGVF